MPRSLPALASGIVQSHRAWWVRSAAAAFEAVPLVPAYQVEPELDVEGQQRRAAQAMAELAPKVARLVEAYPWWPRFEPGPYFDLHEGHLGSFCRVEETQRAVRVRLYADLLLPAFRAAERYWVETFLPAYHAAHAHRNGTGAGYGDAFHDYLVQEAAPELAARLRAAEQSVQGTLDLLGHNLEVLNFLGGLEERIQHRPQAVAPGLAEALQRLPRQMPTLTLDTWFTREEMAWPEIGEPQPEPSPVTVSRRED